jgi:hypothetical protein
MHTVSSTRQSVGRHTDSVDEMKSGLAATNAKLVFAERQKARISSALHSRRCMNEVNYPWSGTAECGQDVSMSVGCLHAWCSAGLGLVWDSDDAHHVLRDFFAPLKLRQRGTAPLNLPTARASSRWQTPAQTPEYGFKLEVGQGDSLPFIEKVLRLIQRYQLCLYYATNFPVDQAVAREGEPRQHAPRCDLVAYSTVSGAMFFLRPTIWTMHPPSAMAR